jgi:hypothetical protein
MAMLTLNGTVQNVFHTPERVDRKTGEIYPAGDRVQLLAENELESGEVRLDLVTLKVANPAAYKALQGRRVAVPVGAFPAGKAVQFYALRGGVPLELPG